MKTQKGSHDKLVISTSTGKKEILTVPNHSEIDTGTLRAIIRQSERYIPEQVLREKFYT
jgi:predicted RNA binding protein YcfA (HicA-like mRNA interferase family)